jgi:excisionase family DNA binding protein
VTLLRGWYTADWAVLWELERSLTILETEYHCNGQPLPEKLDRARSEMRDLIGTARGPANPSETPTGSQNGQSATMTVMAASQLLGVTPQQIRRLCKKGSIKAVMRGRSWRIQRASAEARKRES